MTWEEQFQKWIKADENFELSDMPIRLIERATRNACRSGGELDTAVDWDWVDKHLSKVEDRAFFIASVFDTRNTRHDLARRFLDIGCKEPDMRKSERFVRPAIKALSAITVLNILLNYLCTGTNIEKVGAARARYWLGSAMGDTDVERAHANFRKQMRYELEHNQDSYVQRGLLGQVN